MTSAAAFPYFDTEFQALAHRGGRTGTSPAPENTLAAFRAATELGFGYLETDVHLTRDQQLVAFHDTTLKRAGDSPVAIASLTAAELAEGVLGGHPVPRLSDLLEAFPQARFNIDPKVDDCVAALSEVVSRDGVSERVCVSSFSHARISRFRALVGGRVATGFSTAEVLGFLAAPTFTARRSPAVVLQVPHRVLRERVRLVGPRLVGAAHSLGLRVHVWTVNEAASMAELLDIGVDGIVTDELDVLKSVLIEHRRWKETR